MDLASVFSMNPTRQQTARAKPCLGGSCNEELSCTHSCDLFRIDTRRTIFSPRITICFETAGILSRLRSLHRRVLDRVCIQSNQGPVHGCKGNDSLRRSSTTELVSHDGNR